ncbi:MAG TPA: hypothetical protein VLQ92_11370, partial [Candidatus Limnocylindrales bacterium]|nr:hypothetical protein [Candidatus Limnocylindrales bacterium]
MKQILDAILADAHLEPGFADIETGWFTGLIADAAFEHQRAVEDGRKRVVGVNVHTDAIES